MKMHLLIPVFSVILLLFSACKNTPEEIVINIPEKPIVLPCSESATTEIAITTSDNWVAYTAQKDPPSPPLEIYLTPRSGFAGKNTLKVTLPKPNLSTKTDLEGYIIVQSKEVTKRITIRQTKSDKILVTQTIRLETALKESELDLESMDKIYIFGELQHVDFNSINKRIKYIDLGGCVIKNNSNTAENNIIPGDAFKMNSLTTFISPQNVQVIESMAFYDCQKLAHVTLSDNMTTISGRVFLSCSNLSEISLPDNISYLGAEAFGFCSSLKKIKLPDKLQNMGTSVFKKCTALVSAELPDKLTKIPESTFSECFSLEKITFPDNLTSIGERAFWNCSSLGNITLPDNLTSIEAYAFQSCHNLTISNFPEKLTDIGSYAFNYCHGLKTIALPNAITTLKGASFAQCFNLEQVKLPDNLQTIGYGTFCECPKLKELIFPGKLKSLGEIAFMNCTWLSKLTFLSTVPPSIGEDCFKGTNLSTVYIPTEADKAAYEAINWGRGYSVTVKYRGE